MKLQHKDMKKSRMVRYFINAFKMLALQKPTQSITLREVADAAGFNSATLYNYFKNMDQLIAWSLLDCMTDIWIDTSAEEAVNDDPLYQYLLTWKNQCLHGFSNPYLFITFFVSPSKDAIYAQVEAFLSVFPEKKGRLSERFHRLLFQTDFTKKNQDYLIPCIQQGYLSIDDRAAFMDAGDILFGGMLLQVLKRPADERNARIDARRFFNQLRSTLHPYLLKGESAFDLILSQLQ